MGKKSGREDKNIYLQTREDLDWSREKASEMLESITTDRLVRIESQKSFAHPDEILTMAKVYKNPKLCNYYCANDCPIGKQYVPLVNNNDLSTCILQMIAALNKVHTSKDRLIEIMADGQIDESEVKDFISIQKELEKISNTVESLQLWTEEMLLNGHINNEIYQRLNNEDNPDEQ